MQNGNSEQVQAKNHQLIEKIYQEQTESETNVEVVQIPQNNNQPVLLRIFQYFCVFLLENTFFSFHNRFQFLRLHLQIFINLHTILLKNATGPGFFSFVHENFQGEQLLKLQTSLLNERFKYESCQFYIYLS